MDKDDLGRLLAYTEWANHRVIRATATLALDDWKRDLKGSHGGVRGTLVHILSAETTWRKRSSLSCSAWVRSATRCSSSS